MKLEFYFVFLFVALFFSSKAQETVEDKNGTDENSTYSYGNSTISAIESILNEITLVQDNNTTQSYDNSSINSNTTENEAKFNSTDKETLSSTTNADTNVIGTNSTDKESISNYTNRTDTNSTEDATTISNEETNNADGGSFDVISNEIENILNSREDY